MRALHTSGAWLRGHVMTVLLIAGVSGLLTLGGVLSVGLPAAALPAAAPPDASRFVEARLTVDRAIVAGIDDRSIGTLLADLGAADQEAAAVGTQRRLAEALCAQVTDLRNQAADEPWDTQVAEELSAAEASMHVTLRDLAGARDQLLLAACQGLDGDTAERLEAYCSSEQPISESELRRFASSDLELRTLERALIAERRAQRRGEQLSEPLEDILSAARSNITVVESRVALTQHRDAIRRAVESFETR